MSEQTYIYENKGLGEWLLQLVGEYPKEREIASRVIEDQFYFPKHLFVTNSEFGESAPKLFGEAVRALLASNHFPKEKFVCDLLALRITLQTSWNDYCKKRLKIKKGDFHEFTTVGIAINWVIECLGKEFLPAANYIRQMLGSKDHIHTACGIIERMGSVGIEFYDDLFDCLKEDDFNYSPQKALGVVLRHHTERIKEFAKLLESSNAVVRRKVIVTLENCGQEVTNHAPEVESYLRDMVITKSDWYVSVCALAAIAREAESVSLILSLTYSADEGKVATAIDCFRVIHIKDERIVPRLIELMETFKEYDPDFMYQSVNERIIYALKNFGTVAALAVPALSKRIWAEPETHFDNDSNPYEVRNPDRLVIEFLGELGSLAAEALPALLELQKEMNERIAKEMAGREEEDASPEIYEEETWDVAIRKIREGKE